MKWVKYILSGIFGFLLLLLITVIAIVIFRGDAIKARIVSAVNENINTPIYVRGGIEVEFWSHFPNITVRFNEIEVKESVDFTQRNLLEARKLEFVLNVWDLIRGDYSVRRLIFDTGKLHLEMFKNGTTNFDIFKTQDDSSETQAFDLNIRKAIFKDIHFYFKDFKSGFLSEVLINQAQLSAAFNLESFSADLDADFLVNNLSSGDQQFVDNKHLKLAGILHLDFLEQKYAFEEMFLGIAGFSVSLSGILHRQEFPHLDFTFESKQANFKDLHEILPFVKNDFLKNIKGDFTLTGEINGMLSETEMPSVKGNFSIGNASITGVKQLERIKNLSLDGNFSSGTKLNFSELILSIPEFSLNFDNTSFNGSLRIENLENPYVQTSLNGVFPLALINPFLPGTNYTLSGETIIENFNLAFYPKRLSGNVLGALQQMNGVLKLRDIHISNGVNSIGIKSGILKPANHRIAIENLLMSDDIQHWTANGYVLHVLEYGASVYQKTKPAVMPEVNLSIKGQRLDLEKLFAFFEVTDEDMFIEESEKNQEMVDFTHFKGSLQIDLETVIYDQILGEKFSGKMTFSPGNWKIDAFQFASMGGNFSGDGLIRIRPGNNIDIEGNFSARDVNIQMLFARSWNFGQDFITSEHLSGRISTQVAVGNYWRNGEYDLNRLTVIADVEILDGRLHQFRPMENLSSYIDIQELMDIRFSKLQNRIEIGDSRVFIPGMHIVSNAFVIQLEGIHSFENEIDYNLKVNLSHILANRFRNRNVSKSYWEDNPDGTLNLFLSMKGNAEDPQISYNTVAVRQQVRESFQTQGEDVRRAFRGDLEDYNRGRESRDWDTDEPIELIDWD